MGEEEKKQKNTNQKNDENKNNRRKHGALKQNTAHTLLMAHQLESPRKKVDLTMSRKSYFAKYTGTAPMDLTMSIFPLPQSVTGPKQSEASKTGTSLSLPARCQWTCRCPDFCTSLSSLFFRGPPLGGHFLKSTGTVPLDLPMPSGFKRRTPGMGLP